MWSPYVLDPSIRSSVNVHGRLVRLLVDSIRGKRIIYGSLASHAWFGSWDGTSHEDRRELQIWPLRPCPLKLTGDKKKRSWTTLLLALPSSRRRFFFLAASSHSSLSLSLSSLPLQRTHHTRTHQKEPASFASLPSQTQALHCLLSPHGLDFPLHNATYINRGWHGCHAILTPLLDPLLH